MNLGRLRSLAPARRLRRRRDIALLLKSGLFDPSYYRKQVAKPALSDVAAARHYLTWGVANGVDPHPLFDAAWYLAINEDVPKAGLIPVLHYLRFGAAEGRDPHPLFDVSYYLEHGPDIAGAGVNPLVHFLRFGAKEGRDPHPLFDISRYLEHNPDVAASGMNPLVHYLQFGAKEGRDPHLLFDSSYYLERNPDVVKAGTNPLVHYLQFGTNEGRDPHPLFDTSYYLEHNPDVEASGVEALVHYATCGLGENRNPNPLFDTSFYLERNPDVAAAHLCPLEHYLYAGGFEGRNPGPLFDSDYYLEANPDVIECGQNPLAHFLTSGARQGRAPRRLGLKRQISQLLQAGELEQARDLFELTRLDFPPNREYRTVIAADIKSVESELRRTEGMLLYHEPEEIVLPAPVVHGDCSRPTGGSARLPAEYAGVFEDVTLIGGTRLILANSSLFHDELASFSSADYGVKAVNYLRVDGARALVSFKRKHINEIKTGILISCEYEVNYFHWLVECLPKVAFAETLDIADHVPFLITKGLHPNLMKAFAAVNTKHRPVIELEAGVAYRVQKLFYPSDLSRILDRYEGTPKVECDCVLSPTWIRAATKLVGSVYRGPAKTPWRKLYLTRRNASYRLVRNEADIELMLLEQGFEVADLTGASLESQLALFREAALVVAPTGAAVTNILNAAPQAKFIVLTSNHPAMNFYIFSQLAGIVGIDLEYVTGRRLYTRQDYTMHDDYEMDVDAIRQVVRKKAEEVSQ